MRAGITISVWESMPKYVIVVSDRKETTCMCENLYDMIIVGGGIMAQSEYLRPLINNALKQRLVEAVYTHTKVDFAKLENDAGMLGALYNLLHQTM